MKHKVDLDLPDDMFEKFEKEAARQGVSVESLIEHALKEMDQRKELTIPTDPDLLRERSYRIVERMLDELPADWTDKQRTYWVGWLLEDIKVAACSSVMRHRNEPKRD